LQIQISPRALRHCWSYRSLPLSKSASLGPVSFFQLYIPWYLPLSPPWSLTILRNLCQS